MELRRRSCPANFKYESDADLLPNADYNRTRDDPTSVKDDRAVGEMSGEQSSSMAPSETDFAWWDWKTPPSPVLVIGKIRGNKYMMWSAKAFDKFYRERDIIILEKAQAEKCQPIRSRKEQQRFLADRRRSARKYKPHVVDGERPSGRVHTQNRGGQNQSSLHLRPRRTNPTSYSYAERRATIFLKKAMKHKADNEKRLKVFHAHLRKKAEGVSSEENVPAVLSVTTVSNMSIFARFPFFILSGIYMEGKKRLSRWFKF